jgi:hypothetical protein
MVRGDEELLSSRFSSAVFWGLKALEDLPGEMAATLGVTWSAAFVVCTVHFSLCTKVAELHRF